jgi:GNAT superfamily N-acetyltransferase
MDELTYRIEEIGPPNAQDLEALVQGLREYNRSKIGDLHREVIACFAKDDAGDVVGGIHGAIVWDWLRIDLLWVDDRYRGLGIGRILMEKAESYAQSIGVSRFRVETASFQSLGFYLKLGYQIYGELEDFPPSQTNYYLKKLFR